MENNIVWARQGYMREQFYREWIDAGHGIDKDPQASYYTFIQDELEKARATAPNNTQAGSEASPKLPSFCEITHCNLNNGGGSCVAGLICEGCGSRAISAC